MIATRMSVLSSNLRFTSDKGKLLRFAFTLIATLALCVSTAQAQTNLDNLRAFIASAQNNVTKAAYDFRANGQTAAQLDISQARDAVNSALAGLLDPDVQAKLGKQGAKLSKAMQKALANIGKVSATMEKTSPFGKTVAVIKGINTTANGLLSGNLMLGQPIIAEVDPNNPSSFSKSAGFHKPGDLVTFQINNGGCPDTEVRVLNATSLKNPVDLSTVSYDPVTGRVSMVMGTDEGGADVWVIGCGHTNTMELFNYGSTTAQNLPYGFPQTLQLGTYSITVSATGCYVYVYTDGSCTTEPLSLGPFSAGTIQLSNLKQFAQALGTTGSAIVQTLGQPNQSIGSNFSSETPDSFSWTISVDGSFGGCSCLETATVTVQLVN